MKTTAEVYDIHFDEEMEAVIMEWNGYATSNQFREGTELMLNTLIENKCSKVLANIREMSIIGMDDQEWMETNFIPRAIKFGFKHLVIIPPIAYFSKVSVESISYKVDKEKLTITYVDEKEKGIEFLKSI